MLARDGAGAVGARDGKAEGTLAEARLHEPLRPVATELVYERLRLRPQLRRALQAFGGDAPSVTARNIDRLAALDARVPVGVVGDPVTAGEEDGLRDHDSTDLVVLGTGEKSPPCAAADGLDTRRHLDERVGSVLVAEGLPGEPCGHALACARKKPKPAMALWGAPRRKKNGAPGGIALKPRGEGCQKSTSSGGSARCRKWLNQPKSVLAMKPEWIGGFSAAIWRAPERRC